MAKVLGFSISPSNKYSGLIPFKIDWFDLAVQGSPKSLLLHYSLKQHFSHEIRRQLLLGRKAMTNLDNVLKSKDISLLTKVQIVKAMVFPVVVYR